MTEFLRSLRDRKGVRRLKFSVVPCGGRQATYDAFRNAVKHSPEDLNVLLVDSEVEFTSASARQHLVKCDGWDLGNQTDDSIYLMIQTMETWIVSDVEALAEFYGQGFNRNALPGAADLERTSKTRINAALENSTRATKKGRYHKIRHGSQLLMRIDPDLVRARCPACERVFRTLESLIDQSA